MRRFVFATGFAAALAVAPLLADKIPATGGDIEITPLGHASVQVEFAGKTIQVDPAPQAYDLAKAKQADLVLITDIHGDHLDPASLAKVRKSGGLGLGLNIAKSFAEMHGAELLLESEPGRGTAARLILPKARLVRAGAFELSVAA